MGCLAAPFKLLGVIGLVAALAIGWLYRDRLGTELKRIMNRPDSGEPTGAGRPGARALISANAKIDSLNGWGADSVVLTPSEVASLMGLGSKEACGGSSIRSRWSGRRRGGCERHACHRTAPRELIGPLAVALRAKER